MFLNYPEENFKSQKTSISQFLYDNSAYDCMPKNSYIAAIDKQLSIYDAIQLLISQNHQQLLMWDNQTIQWNWIFSLADAIRFTLFAVRQIFQYKQITFETHPFRKLSEDRIQKCSGFKLDQISQQSNHEKMVIEQPSEIEFNIKNYAITQELKEKLLNESKKVTLFYFMNEVYNLKTFELTSVTLDTKLSFIILKMLSEKIHRIIVYQKSSKMFTSILNYKDILLFLLRSVNQQFTNTSEYNIPIGSLIQGIKSKQNTIHYKQNVWSVFNTMINKNKVVWLNIIDDNGCYITTIFRDDFKFILNGWKIHLLSLSVLQFLQIKRKQVNQQNNIPEFQMFNITESIKQIVQKIVMCKRNTIVCIDQNRKIISTLGLSELFRLYIQ